MSILSVLAGQQRHDQESIRNMGKVFQRERLNNLGKQFLRHGDFSPEGLKSFAEQNNVQLPEMQALIQVVKQFREYEKQALPVTKDYETQGPEGNKYTFTKNMEDPNADPLAMLVKERVKRQLKEQVDPSGGRSMIGVSPFDLSAKSVTGEDGQPVRTGLPEQDAKEKSIQRLIETGVSPERAIKVVEKAIRPGTDAFGRISSIDLTEQKSSTEQPIVQPIAQEQKKDKFIDEETVRQGTGPISGIRQTLNNVIGWATEGVPFEATAESRNKVKIFAHNVKTAIVNNPRFPVAEQETVKGFLPDPDKFFKDPDEAISQLKNLREFLSNQKKQKANIMLGGNITGDQFKTYQDQINNIDIALSMIPDFNTQPEAATKEPSQSTGLEELSDEEILRELGL